MFIIDKKILYKIAENINMNYYKPDTLFFFRPIGCRIYQYHVEHVKVRET
jgi:hypothetical protein